jgi:hypothetical protein
MEKVQISAFISRTTRDLLERHVRATGVKKGHLLDEALRHHLQALQEIPLDLVVHPRIVISRDSGQEVLIRIERGRPTRALRRLMRDADQGSPGV